MAKSDNLAERRALQAIDGKAAWKEHLAEQEATKAKTERLRAERLAMQASGVEKKKKPPGVVARMPKPRSR
jgi:hypothetical protein